MLDGEVIQESFDVLGRQLAGMALAGEQNVPPDPVDVGLLGAKRVMQGANACTDLVEEARSGWMVIITGGDRHPARTNDEKLVLFDSVLAYSGLYTIEGDRITVKVDMSSNEVFTGANQIQTRFFTLEGDKLTVRTPEMTSAALPGKKVIGTNIFVRER